MEQKINLEQILWDSFHKFGIPKPTHTLAEITQKAVKDAMKEAIREALKLAADNAKIGGNNLMRMVDKQSILNTINQVG